MSDFYASGKGFDGNGMTIYGDNNNIDGNCNSVYGNHNEIDGNSNNIIGDKNEVDGNCNNISGDSNDIDGNSNTIKGNKNKIDGNHNNIIGENNEIDGNHNTFDKETNKVVEYSGGNSISFGNNAHSKFSIGNCRGSNIGNSTYMGLGSGGVTMTNTTFNNRETKFNGNVSLDGVELTREQVKDLLENPARKGPMRIGSMTTRNGRTSIYNVTINGIRVKAPGKK